ncbi:MAG TPA: S26 family signal peptidase, partial [Bacteroidales bacterium]|nr:S26 family signal peptidase [Bacteroidales bacterium]
MKELLRNKYFKFGVAGVLYILWVIWVGNYWLLLGLPIVFDIYVSKKVNWAFWKKRHGKNHVVVEWLDALIFAVIAVSLINIFLFQNYRIPTPSMEKTLLVGDHLAVSKVAYGPRMPNTPLVFPFTQHTMPFTGGRVKSWSDLIHWKYNRLKGFGHVKNNDIVVFNFPAGDTVCLEQQAVSYYEILRERIETITAEDIRAGRPLKGKDEYYSVARQMIWNEYTVIYRPVDRRDNYVKRCVGIPGDTVLIKGGKLFINGHENTEYETQQTSYYVRTNGTRINPKAFERMGVSKSDQSLTISGSGYRLPLTRKNAETISGFANVTGIEADYRRPGEYIAAVFPHDPAYRWNEDNFGPLWIPKKGTTVKLDMTNINFYTSIIDIYEENDLEIRDTVIYINGKPADSYTFRMDY